MIERIAFMNIHRNLRNHSMMGRHNAAAARAPGDALLMLKRSRSRIEREGGTGNEKLMRNK